MRGFVTKRIAFTGDLAFSRYFKGTYAREDLLDQAVVDYLCDADYNVANVEGCISSGTGSAAKPLLHANPPECVDFLKKINANIWTLANNHITDCGREGLESTLNIAAENGVQTIGIGLNEEQAAKPVIIENDGADIGIIALTYWETPEATETSEGCIRWNNDAKVSEIIAQIKQTCRWCVVVVHCGDEFAQLPMPYVRNQYHKYLQWGADVVVGHHPHIVENYETVGDKVIFYSLGNFIFDTDYQRLQRYTEFGMLVKLTFTENEFSWDHMATLIDRENHRILPGKDPDIFTDVSPRQYALLWPLAARNLFQNDLVKYPYLFPYMKEYSKKEWKHWKKKYFSNVVGRGKDVKRGLRLCRLNLWRLGDKKIVNYIKNAR